MTLGAAFEGGDTGFHAFFDGIDHIEVERFATGTGFFGAVECCDNFDGGGQRLPSGV